MATNLETLTTRNLKNMHRHATQQLTHWRSETSEAVSALLLAKENLEYWEKEIAQQEAALIARGEIEAEDIIDVDAVDEDVEGELLHVDVTKKEVETYKNDTPF